MTSYDAQPGYLHGVLQVLLTSRITYDARAEELQKDANDIFKAVAMSLMRAGMRTTAQDVARRAHLFRNAATPLLNEGAVAFDRAAYGVLQALAGQHGLYEKRPPPPFEPGPQHAVGHGNALRAERFEPDMEGRAEREFVRTYARGIINDRSERIAMTKDQLRHVPRVTAQQVIDTKEEILALLPERYRDRARDLLYAEGTHAVEYHGPHLTEEHLTARCIWARPTDHGAHPDDSWGMKANGEVWVKSHRTPASYSGRFTSPEAFATALASFFKKADSFQGGMPGLLAYNAVRGRATVHISMRDGGLGPGDTERYRPAGVRNSQSAQDWLHARKDAMEPDSTSGPSVPVKRDDPAVTSSGRGGQIKFVFDEVDDRQWQLITMFT